MSGRDRSPRRSRGGGGGGRGGGGPMVKGPADRRVFISNLPFEMKWQEVKDLFRREVGEVAFVELFNDEKGKPRGAGIMEFGDAATAKKAIDKMHRYELKDRKLVVKEDFDVERDKYGRIVKGSERRDGGRGGHDGGRREMGGGGGGGGAGNYGSTYGLSPQFLDSLGIDGPLHDRIFVANLAPSVDEKKLREVFSMSGRVVGCELVRDKEGKPRGFALVTFDHPVEAVQAISMFHNQQLLHYTMKVRYDKLPENGPGKDRERLQPNGLPEGLEAIGMGLGAGGSPLTDVARNLPNGGGDMGMGGGNSGMGMGGGPPAVGPDAMTTALAAIASIAGLGNLGNAIGGGIAGANMGGNVNSGMGNNVGGGGDLGMRGGDFGGNPGMSMGQQGGMSNMGMTGNNMDGGPSGMRSNMGGNAGMRGDMGGSSGMRSDMGGSSGMRGDMGGPSAMRGRDSGGMRGGEIGMRTSDMDGPRGNRGGDMGRPQDNRGGDMGGMSRNMSGPGDMGPPSGIRGGDMGGSNGPRGNMDNGAGLLGSGMGMTSGMGRTGMGSMGPPSGMSGQSPFVKREPSSPMGMHGMGGRDPTSPMGMQGMGGRDNDPMGRGSSSRSSDTIIVRNLPMDAAWQGLKERFSHAGDVKYAEMKERGVGLVRFSNERDAERAVSMMDGQRVDGGNIQVSLY